MQKIQLWYNQSSLYWPVLGVFSIGIFSWWRRGIPLWIPRGSPSRQGLFTSEQKADPTPRLFVPLSRKRACVVLSMGHRGHFWYLSMDVGNLKCHFLTKGYKRSNGINYCPICIVYVILLYHCVISMVSRYLAWDHEGMPHICLGQSHVFILQIEGCRRSPFRAHRAPPGKMGDS